MYTRLKSLIDWDFVGNSSLNSIFFALGRVLGFVYTFIAARAFSESEYGEILYVITLGSILAIIAQPFHQHVLAYYIGKFKDDKAQLQEYIGNFWTISLFLFAISACIGVPALILLERFHWAVLVVYAGTVFFYGYWGLATGYLASRQIMLAYIGSNIFQAILVTIAVYLFNVQTIGPVIAIYGVAYFIPILLLYRSNPLELYPKLKFDWGKIKTIGSFSFPIWISHILYQVQISTSIVLLEFYIDTTTLGIFGLTATLVQVFGFISQGIVLVLMPKIASMDAGRVSLTVVALAVTIVGNLFGLLVYALIYPWFITTFFGAEYFLSLNFGLLMAIGVIMNSLHGVLTNSLVGMGKPSYETISRLAIAPIVVIISVLLIPTSSAMGAAWALVLGPLAGIIVYILLITRWYMLERKVKHENESQ